MKVNLTDTREVFNFCEPYIIAELGSNHNGDMKLAENMIRAAGAAGADCVKFQSWSKDSIFSKKVYDDNFFLKDDYRNRKDYTLEKIVEKFSISESELLEMKKIADEVGIDMISTPFSKKEVDFLVDKLHAPFIKVASMDANNYPFLKYIARKGKPIVMSTGLSTLSEIDKAISVIEAEGNTQIVILHCISIYPPEDRQVNLNNIPTYQKLYPYPVGFSDHTIGYSIPLASVALGACVIEKHFTLDKTMVGWDHKVSADEADLRIMCTESKRIHKALGSTRIVSQESQERKDAFRRSVVAAKDIKQGEIITEKDLDVKRPGTGLPPEAMEYIIGKTARRNIGKDQIIEGKDF
ncbi:MAG: N-acetylneuraminate synthase family protein [Candidatus Paceibacterota bacterium]|jgi:N-acetylneuraminate synthase